MWGSDDAPAEETVEAEIEVTSEQQANLDDLESERPCKKQKASGPLQGLENFSSESAASDAKELLLYNLQKHPDRVMMKAGYFVAVCAAAG